MPLALVHSMKHVAHGCEQHMCCKVSARRAREGLCRTAHACCTLAMREPAGVAVQLPYNAVFQPCVADCSHRGAPVGGTNYKNVISSTPCTTF